MSLTDAQIGQTGENAAVKYLEDKKYKIVDRNYELPMGELDIIAKKDKRFYFVEVKASLEFDRSVFRPDERVDKRKRQRLQNLCEAYILREGLSPDTEWQIDVVSVTLDKLGGIAHIDHIENAVWDYRGV